MLPWKGRSLITRKFLLKPSLITSRGVCGKQKWSFLKSKYSDHTMKYPKWSEIISNGTCVHSSTFCSLVCMHFVHLEIIIIQSLLCHSKHFKGNYSLNCKHIQLWAAPSKWLGIMLDFKYERFQYLITNERSNALIKMISCLNMMKPFIAICFFIHLFWEWLQCNSFSASSPGSTVKIIFIKFTENIQEIFPWTWRKTLLI